MISEIIQQISINIVNKENIDDLFVLSIAVCIILYTLFPIERFVLVFFPTKVHFIKNHLYILVFLVLYISLFLIVGYKLLFATIISLFIFLIVLVVSVIDLSYLASTLLVTLCLFLVAVIANWTVLIPLAASGFVFLLLFCMLRLLYDKKNI